ncbi:hypothetical protein HMPREF0970_01672 [Schaalia odontolytica F0309]|uniref:Uncharacterized protein n=1 Tax=Schaalia odontolytica F0309 TaxID=649742 RepID=D4U0D2_9ACTO|nr:hypothetical protein HMPREF0970_01672 [Schaalia odontolytica F0309]
MTLVLVASWGRGAASLCGLPVVWSPPESRDSMMGRLGATGRSGGTG